ncbi:hypothetical protein ACU635_27625 [[Actinomadura] parvosata]|uniref:hypothetical protein n=1 Tax=[Actinomadura] parvosata TaxID=1955412 RepID=UPI00406CF961
MVKEILAGHTETRQAPTPSPDDRRIRGELPGQAAEDDAADAVTPMYRLALPERCVAEPSPGVLLIPYRHQAQDVRDLPADYQAPRAAVRSAGGPLICKAICEQLGLPIESGQVEGAGQAEPAGRAGPAAQNPRRRVRPAALPQPASPGTDDVRSPCPGMSQRAPRQGHGGM